MLSMCAGGGWGLNPSKVWWCISRPARTALHPSLAEGECVAGMPSSLVLL